MSTRSCINIVSSPSLEKKEIEFFYSNVWDSTTESSLFQQVYELLQLVRPMGKKLQLTIDIEVNDAVIAVHMINRKLKSGVIINNQKLSIREIEVLGLVMQGMTTKKISERLFICFETVRSHRKNILAKTGAKNTAALINHYHQTFFEK